MTRIKAIIFDCDGTLIESEEAHLSAWNQAAKKWNLEINAEERSLYIGKPDDLFVHLFAKKIGYPQAKELLIQKKKYFLEFSQQRLLPPIEGTVNFVRQLQAKRVEYGLKLAVASAAIKEEVCMHLKTLALDNVFDAVISGHEDLIGYSDPEGVNKPKPYIYLHTAKQLGVHPSECIAIEDSYTGVTAGVSAGCYTIAIPNSLTKDHDLSRAALKLDSLANFTVEQFLEIATVQIGRNMK